MGYKTTEYDCFLISTAHLLSTSTIMFFKSALFSLAAIAAAKEMPKDEIMGAELYDSGIRHANNMALKHVSISCRGSFPPG
jgi:hypothetical protein